jgi:nucleoside-diphosphate-sugar epimerase
MNEKIIDIPVETLGSIASEIKSGLGIKSRFFITGGTGIIGKWLLAVLTYLKFTSHVDLKVTILSRTPSSFKKLYPEFNWVDCIEGNIQNPINSDVQAIDYFIHGATDVIAQNSYEETLKTTVLGTFNALRFAEICSARKFHLISSGAVYGKSTCPAQGFNESQIAHIDFLNTNSAYSLGKMSSEAAVFNWKSSCMQVRNISRLFANFGTHVPLNSHFAIANFVNDVVTKREEIVISGDGLAQRSYLHVSDISRAILKIAILGQHSGQAYNVGSPQKITIKKLAKTVVDLAGECTKITVLGNKSNQAHSEIYFPCVNKYEKEFGKITNVNFEAGLIEYLQWGKSLYE